MLRTYVYLFAAIVLEIIATTALARSASFTRAVPSLVAILGYAGAFWFLSTPLRVLPTGIVYAIWSGLGIVLITAVAWLWQKQRLDAPALVGLALILAGVLVIHLFSTSVKH
ncbi:MAG: Methyl viologen resistance protein [Pseudomonadota bacterium]|jgi:small multidrug resistance pump